MQSFYDLNPQALETAARRMDFRDRLLAGTGLLDIIMGDPEPGQPGQERAKRDLNTVIDRAFQLYEQAKEAQRGG